MDQAGKLLEQQASIPDPGGYRLLAEATVLEEEGDCAENGDLARWCYLRSAERWNSYRFRSTSGGEAMARAIATDRIDRKRKSQGK